MKALVSFFIDEDGASLAEYVLLLGLIVMAVISTTTSYLPNSWELKLIY